VREKSLALFAVSRKDENKWKKTKLKIQLPMKKTQIQTKITEKVIISKGIIGDADGAMVQFTEMVLQESTTFNFQKDGIIILLVMN
jgi:hypothetical protein